jgi:hypothetical protein
VPLFLGFLLASCSIDVDDLSGGSRDKRDGGIGGEAGFGTSAAGSGGFAGSGAGNRGSGGLAGLGGADPDAAGAGGTSGGAGSGGFSGRGGTGAAGTTGEAGPDAAAGSGGQDASDDGGTAGGSGGQSGATGSGGTSGAGGNSGGSDATVVDSGSNDAPLDESDASDASALCQGGVCKRVFVSANPLPSGGDLGGLMGADDFCQSTADTKLLGGTWKAWLSDGTISASARLTHATVPYVLLDGSRLGANWTALTSGTLAHAIDVSEDGTPHAATLEVWTGTTSAGAFSGRSCSAWTNNAPGSATADVGLSNETNSDWTNAFQQYCDRLNVHLYCLEQ